MDSLLLFVCFLLLYGVDTLETANVNTSPPILKHCSLPVKSCEPLQKQTCLGTVLPYTHTSVVLANDSVSQEEAQHRLDLWSRLASVPRCWEVVQPLLCSIYLPFCNASKITRPSFEQCEKTREPCKIVYRSYGWPDFLKCEASHFVTGCKVSTKSFRKYIYLLFQILTKYCCLAYTHKVLVILCQCFIFSPVSIPRTWSLTQQATVRSHWWRLTTRTVGMMRWRGVAYSVRTHYSQPSSIMRSTQWSEYLPHSVSSALFLHWSVTSYNYTVKPVFNGYRFSKEW